MLFELDKFLARHRSELPDLERLFNEPGRGGTLLEMPHNLPASIIADFQRRTREVDFSRYPGKQAAELRGKIANWLEIPPSHGVMLGNGGSPLIESVIQRLGRNKTVLSLAPDFFMYAIAAKANGATLVTHELSRDFCLDLTSFLAEIDTSQPELVVLSNPNNPTSMSYESTVIEAILEHAPGIVMIDEIYGAFHPEPDMHLGLLGKYPNLLILRSFSKVGAAAIRFGYLLGDMRVIDTLTAGQSPFPVNSLSMLAAESIIDHYPDVLCKVDNIIAERDAMVVRMGGLPDFTVYPSATNFIVLRSNESRSLQAYDDLIASGVPVHRYTGTQALENCLRVSVTTHEMNALAVAQLRSGMETMREER